MTIPHKRVQAALKNYVVKDWRRIIETRHKATPTDTGKGNSRFVRITDPYRVLYAAVDFKTAFAEVIIRDSYVGMEKRELPQSKIDQYSLAILSGPSEGLMMLNISGDGAYTTGINTDAKGSRDHTAGQELAEELYKFSEIDGIVFSSRMGATDCIAVFDRAFHKLTASHVYPIMKSSDLSVELKRMDINVV